MPEKIRIDQGQKYLQYLRKVDRRRLASTKFYRRLELNIEMMPILKHIELWTLKADFVNTPTEL